MPNLVLFQELPLQRVRGPGVVICDSHKVKAEGLRVQGQAGLYSKLCLKNI